MFSIRFFLPRRHGEAIIVGNDTIPFFVLPTYYCYPPLKFKNKKEEQFYWRTVHDVKVVLPYVRHIRKVMDKTNVKGRFLSEFPPHAKDLAE